MRDGVGAAFDEATEARFDEVKHRISHRGLAAQKAIAFLQSIQPRTGTSK
jgi:hypothetical protein